MKNKNSKIKRRLIAIALSAVALTSFGTTTVVTASAAVANTSLSTSYTNKEETKEEKQEGISEGTVESVVEAAISTAQGDYIKAIKTSLEMLPYGKSISALFEYGVGLISELMNEGKPSETPAPSITDIKVELDKVQEQLGKISGTLLELKNQEFKTNINNLIRLYSKFNSKIYKLADARYELAKAKETGKSSSIIGQKETNAKKALSEIINLKEKDLTDLKNGIEVCTQYMCGKSLGGFEDNPFYVNYQAELAEASNGSFAFDIFNKSVETYDNLVWAYYTNALTLYTDIQHIKINKLIKTDPVAAQEAANDLQYLLNGKLSDETEVEEEINSANALKYYKEEVTRKELMDKNQYKYNNEWKTVFAEIGTAKANRQGFLPTGNLVNRKMVNYIDNASHYGKRTATNEAFSNNFIYLNDMIKQYKKLCETTKTLTFRQFFEENMCITLPENCKYLVTGQMQTSCYTMIDHLFTMDIPVISLDEERAEVEKYRVSKTDDFHKYIDRTLDNLCYLAESVHEATEKVAVVTESGGKEVAFDSFEDAWEYANYRGSCTIKLFSDVTAQPVEGTNEKSFGTGECFTRGKNNGALYVRNYITLDLNGHTIDRNQEKAVADGSVFILDEDGVSFSVINTSSKKGVITGGNTTGNGGAFYDTNTSTMELNLSSVSFKNVIITGNHANGLGGGLFFSSSSHADELIIDNCEITNNTAGTNGGGIYCQSGNVYTADVTLKGCVNITNNTVNNRKNNATLTDTAFGKAVFNVTKDFSTSSRIGVNSTTTDKTLRITNYIERIKDCSAVFSADNSNKQIKINKRTFGSSYYAEIRNA